MAGSRGDMVGVNGEGEPRVELGRGFLEIFAGFYDHMYSCFHQLDHKESTRILQRLEMALNPLARSWFPPGLLFPARSLSPLDALDIHIRDVTQTAIQPVPLSSIPAGCPRHASRNPVAWPESRSAVSRPGMTPSTFIGHRNREPTLPGSARAAHGPRQWSPAFSQSQSYISVAERRRIDLERLEKHFQIMACAESPFVPTTVQENLDHSIWESKRDLSRRIDIANDRNQQREAKAAGRIEVGVPLPNKLKWDSEDDYMSRNFAFNDAVPTSTVLGAKTVWKSSAAPATQAAWPTLAELKAYGDERARGRRGGRVLPQPRYDVLSKEAYMQRLAVQGHVGQADMFGGIPWKDRENIIPSELDRVGYIQFQHGKEQEDTKEEDETEVDLDIELMRNLINKDICDKIDE